MKSERVPLFAADNMRSSSFANICIRLRNGPRRRETIYFCHLVADARVESLDAERVMKLPMCRGRRIDMRPQN
jgi:hypothetical protein